MTTRAPMPLSCIVLLLAAAGAAHAQITLNAPGLQASAVATGLPLYPSELAVDRDGNAFLVESGTATGNPFMVGTRTVAMVTASGTLVSGYALFGGAMSQMTTNPMDGRVYVAISPTIYLHFAQVYRLDPLLGPVPVFQIDVRAGGFAIDALGQLYASGMGPAGRALYRLVPPFVEGAMNLMTPVFIGDGGTLLALPSHDILITDGSFDVERWSPVTGVLSTYFTPSFLTPHGSVRFMTVARSPFALVGAGAIIAYEWYELLPTLTVYARPVYGGSLSSASATAPLAQLALTTTVNGMAMAAGPRRDLYWTINSSTTGAPSTTLWRIEEVPLAGTAGSLLVSAAPGSLSVDLWGATAGSPILLGAILGAPPATMGFYGPWGTVTLDPLASGFMPVLDGIGAFAPPNPAASIPASGHLALTFSVPPSVPAGLVFTLQAIELCGPAAPNGYFLFSNTAPFTTL